MGTIRIKLTKKQAEILKPLEDEVDTAYKIDKPGAIIGQFYPEGGFFKCLFYTNEQMEKLHAAFNI